MTPGRVVIAPAESLCLCSVAPYERCHNSRLAMSELEVLHLARKGRVTAAGSTKAFPCRGLHVRGRYNRSRGWSQKLSLTLSNSLYEQFFSVFAKPAGAVFKIKKPLCWTHVGLMPRVLIQKRSFSEPNRRLGRMTMQDDYAGRFSMKWRVLYFVPQKC